MTGTTKLHGKLRPKLKVPNQKKLTAFAVKVSNVMIEAGQLGLFKTQHSLHDAVRSLGWEIEYNLIGKARK